MMTRLRKPRTALWTALYLCCFLTSPALAGMIGSVSSDPDAGRTRTEETARVQQALETQIVQEKLCAYGLTPEEARQRVEGLPDEQVHLLAQASDRLLAGGDGGEAVVAALVIILLVVLILYLMDKKIIIR